VAAKKGLKSKSPDEMQEIKFTLSIWHYGKLKLWAKENGMPARAAIRYIINQFFKSNQ
jgi:hypothetical protein